MQEQNVAFISEKLSELFGVEFVITAAVITNGKGADGGQEKEQKTA